MAEQICSQSGLPLRGRHEPSSMSPSNLTEDAISPRNLKLRHTNLSTISMDEDCQNHIHNHCERFDRYTSFLGSGTPLDSAKAVQETVAEIDQIMIEAERAIQEKMVRLRREVDQFASDVSEYSDAHWYRNIEDLTAYDENKFAEILRNMRIRDVNDFAAYLEESLPAASLKTRPDHEYSGMTFVGKVHLLLERVLSSARYPVAFSLLAVVKAKVLLPYRPRASPRPLAREIAWVDSELLRLIELHTRIDEKDEDWDFASSWRTLVYAWEDMACDVGYLLRLLGPMQKKAETEIRHRTNIAVNGRLPQELADLVFEQAMELEELPLEPE